MVLERHRRARIAAAVAVVCLGGIGSWWRARSNTQFFQPARLLSRFPVEDAAVLSADFLVLRQAGMLGESKTLEPDYRKFVDGTGFDYKRDLDQVTAAFLASGNYYIARGRFDWAKLRAYAAQQGGSCYQDLCRMPGSTPERHISFLPLRNDTIALAVSTNDLAASRLQNPGQPITANIPSGPVWLSVPGAVFRSRSAMPAGFRGMFTGLQNTDRVVVNVEPSAAGLEARMEATCRSTADAAVLASQLRIATSALRDALKAQQQDDELAKMLQNGTFEENGSRVMGRWPLAKMLLDSLTQGI